MSKREAVPAGTLEVFEVYHLPLGRTWNNRERIGVYEDEEEAERVASTYSRAKVTRRLAVHIGTRWFLLASVYNENIVLKKEGSGQKIVRYNRGLVEAKEALEGLVILKEHKDIHGKDASYRILQPKAWEYAFRAVGKEYKPSSGD